MALGIKYGLCFVDTVFPSAFPFVHFCVTVSIHATLHFYLLLLKSDEGHLYLTSYNLTTSLQNLERKCIFLIFFESLFMLNYVANWNIFRVDKLKEKYFRMTWSCTGNFKFVSHCN